MENMISKQTKKIEICEVDYANHYKIYHMFTTFAELATENGGKIGLWTDEMKGKYGWVIAKQTLTLKEPVRVDDIIEFSTIIGNGSSAIFPRYYFIKKEGREVGVCSAIWTLLDLTRRRIVIPSRVGLTVPVVKHDFKLDTPKSIDFDGELNHVMTRKVLYSDVDLNQHMNNARYIDWALDLIDLEVHRTHFINEVTIHYKKEILPLAQVELYMGQNENRYVVEGRNQEGEVHFLIEIQFTKENNPTK